MTSTAVATVKSVLNEANPNKLADALQKVQLGSVLDIVDTGEVTLGTVAATVTLNPPALAVLSCDVTDVSGGTGALGARVIAVTAAAAPHAAGAPGLANINAAGTVITFEGTVKKYRVTYLPRPAVALSAAFGE
jgi:hypothetical protein